MGQRLVIRVWRKEEDMNGITDNMLAAIYLHWSAYTIDEMYELRDLARLFKACDAKNMSNDNVLLTIADYLEKRGGGVNLSDYAYMSKHFPGHFFNNENVNRSRGLLCVQEETIQGAIDWAEGISDIFIDDESVYTGCFITDDEPEEDFKDLIPVIEIPCIGAFTYEELERLTPLIEACADYNGFFTNKKKTEYIQLI